MSLQIIKHSQEEADRQFDEIVLAMGQDKDYAICYWDKHNEECGLCLGAMKL